MSKQEEMWHFGGPDGNLLCGADPREKRIALRPEYIPTGGETCDHCFQVMIDRGTQRKKRDR